MLVKLRPRSGLQLLCWLSWLWLLAGCVPAPSQTDAIKVEYLYSEADLAAVMASAQWQPYQHRQTLAKQGWLKIRLQHAVQDPQQRYLLLAKSSFKQGVLLQPPLFAPQQLAMTAPPPSLGYTSFNFVMPLTSSAQQGQPLYIRLDSGRWSGDLLIGDAVSLLQYESAFRHFLPFSLGTLLFGLLFALVMLAHFKERVYLSFGCYLLATIGFFLDRTGALYEVPVGRWFAEIYQHNTSGITISLLFLTSLRFIADLANLKQISPLLNQFARLLSVILALMLLLRLLGVDLYQNYLLLQNLLYLIVVVFVFSFCVYCTVKRSRYALFALAGQSVLIPVAFIMLLSTLGVEIRFDPEHFWLPMGYTIEMLVFAAGLADRALAFKQQRDTDYQIAHQDNLTQVLNRHALTDRLRQFAHLPYAQHQQYYVAMLDIDHFKAVNDQYGHQAGDQCLSQMAKLAKSCLRQQDEIYRYGGEEFLLLLKSDHIDLARDICERVRLQVKKYPLQLDGQPIPVTLSIGLASLQQHLDIQHAIVAADQALYQSKQQGRDRLTLAS